VTSRGIDSLSHWASEPLSDCVIEPSGDLKRQKLFNHSITRSLNSLRYSQRSATIGSTFATRRAGM
jgi:hypothetical protein